MSEWAFRVRVHLADQSRVGVEQKQIAIETSLGDVLLAGADDVEGSSISKSANLILRGTASSEGDALDRGARALDALQRTFSRLRVGADLGRLFGTGGLFFKKGLELLGHTPETPLLNDALGLMVFEAAPAPRFVRSGGVTAIRTSREPPFETAFRAAVELGDVLDEEERLAFDLFASSFFNRSADARLLALVMSIETLIDPPNRSERARDHVLELIQQTRTSSLIARERDSLVGSLQWLLKESISSTGRRYVGERLGDRTYSGMTASQLWDDAYNLRGRLVHGASPRPSTRDVGLCAASLEVLVSELLSGPLLSTLP